MATLPKVSRTEPTGIEAFRADFPQYSDMDDDAVVDAMMTKQPDLLYKYFYSDMDRGEFDRRLAERMAPPPQEDWKAGVLPYRQTPEGKNVLDFDQGVTGLAKRVVTLPRDVMTSKLDPSSREGMGRMLEGALMMSPVSAGTRAAPRMNRWGPKPPSVKKLKKETSANYKVVEDAGIEYTPQSIKTLMDEIETTLANAGRLQPNNPELYNLLHQLRRDAQHPEAVSMDLTALDSFRQLLSEVAGDPKPSISAAGTLAIKQFDDFLNNTARSSVVTRPGVGEAEAKAAVEALNTARGNAAAGYRAERLNKLNRNIEQRTSAASSGMNLDNSTRQRLISFMDNANKIRGFSEEEMAVMDKIIAGGKVKNALRHISNILGGGGGMGLFLPSAIMGTAGSFHSPTAAGLGYLALPAVGRTTKLVENALSRAEIRALNKLVRSRSPLHQKNVANAPLKKGAVRAPGTKKLAAQLAGQPAAQDPSGRLGSMLRNLLPPEVPLAAGGTQADLLQRRLLDSLKRSGQPWT